MAQEPHQRIIQGIAKSTLGGAGLIQKGRSRVWYDDHSWYVIVVEFQPFSGRKATFLNVGINWLWRPKEFWSFDVGGRVGDFIPYVNDATFSSEFSCMVSKALRKVEEIRTCVAAPADAYVMIEQDRDQDAGWRNYHLGVAAGLDRRTEAAARHLSSSSLMNANREVVWEKQRAESAKLLLDSVRDKMEFRNLIEGRIGEARALLKLPPLSGHVFSDLP